LFFLSLPDAELAVARASSRVAQGGHDIPEAQTKQRYLVQRSASYSNVEKNS
jgi:predicted ABC-type ATPase